MLGGGSDGAMQLPGRTSVVPGGHSWPAATRVPPRMPCAASAAPSAALMMMMAKTGRVGRMESPFSHEPPRSTLVVDRRAELPRDAGYSELLDLVVAVTGAAQHRIGVLTEQRRAPPRIERCARHLDRRPYRAQPAECRMIDIKRHLASDGLRRRQGIFVIEDRPARHAGLLELVDPERARLGARDRVDQRGEVGLVLHPLVVGGETLICHPFRMAEHARDFHEVAVVGSADRDVTIRAAE